MSVPVPRLAATIERRLLINYRVDPGVASALLPASLRPQLVDGSAVAGICLLRLGAVRPVRMHRPLGWRAENAAHRIAVEWDDAAGTHVGVYIPERHTESWLPVAVGGRLFPGVHHHARFTSEESDDDFRVAMTSSGTSVAAEVALAHVWRSSLFATVDDASTFFRNGSVGWSPSHDRRNLEGLTLSTTQWRVSPGIVRDVQSSFFDALPAGSARLDSVLVMRGVPITWSLPTMSAPAGFGAREEPLARA